MKVLILTYHWPPAGGSGVQRWLKFVKYLPEFGIEPIVYCPENPNYIKLDESLGDEIPKGITILKSPINEASRFVVNSKNKQKGGVSNITNNKFLSFVRGNLFVPDPKVTWVKSSVNYLTHFLNKHQVDAIISSGPPHSMHLIAMELKKRFQLRWIADFRDPWTDLYYNQDFYQLPWVKRKNSKLEKEVLQSVDTVITVSQTLQSYFDTFAKDVKVITNGYDDEELLDEDHKLDSKFSISYIGLLPKSSIPFTLFEVLEELVESNSDFKSALEINFIGDINTEVKTLVEQHNLSDNTNFIGYVSHEMAISYQRKSRVLLLLIPNVKNNQGILTGKLFEYLASKRPILAFGPKGADLENILSETHSGVVLEYSNKNEIKKQIDSLYKSYKEKTLEGTCKGYEKYHRKNLTGQLAKLLHQSTT